MIGRVLIAFLFLFGVEGGRFCEWFSHHVQRGLIGSHSAKFLKKHCYAGPTGFPKNNIPGTSTYKSSFTNDEAR